VGRGERFAIGVPQTRLLLIKDLEHSLPAAMRDVQRGCRLDRLGAHFSDMGIAARGRFALDAFFDAHAPGCISGTDVILAFAAASRMFRAANLPLPKRLLRIAAAAEVR
jgi:hypothetical protein